MNISFQFKNMDVDQSMQNHITDRLKGLRKFFSEQVQFFVLAEKPRSSHNGDDLYYISLNIEDGKYQYFIDEYEKDVRTAFDNLYDESFRLVRDDKKKERNIARRAGARLKKLFRKRT